MRVAVGSRPGSSSSPPRSLAHLARGGSHLGYGCERTPCWLRACEIEIIEHDEQVAVRGGRMWLGPWAEADGPLRRRARMALLLTPYGSPTSSTDPNSGG